MSWKCWSGNGTWHRWLTWLSGAACTVLCVSANLPSAPPFRYSRLLCSQRRASCCRSWTWRRKSRTSTAAQLPERWRESWSNHSAGRRPAAWLCSILQKELKWIIYLVVIGNTNQQYTGQLMKEASLVVYTYVTHIRSFPSPTPNPQPVPWSSAPDEPNASPRGWAAWPPSPWGQACPDTAAWTPCSSRDCDRSHNSSPGKVVTRVNGNYKIELSEYFANLSSKSESSFIMITYVRRVRQTIYNKPGILTQLVGL